MILKDLAGDHSIQRSKAPDDESAGKNSGNKAYAIQDRPETMVSEPDENMFWLVARELRRINDSLDTIKALVKPASLGKNRQ